MHDGCTKLTTIDTTRQSLKLTNLHSDNNATLDMNPNGTLTVNPKATLEMRPFLIRSENGNVAVTLSERLNDTNSRCYQICEYDP